MSSGRFLERSLVLLLGTAALAFGAVRPWAYWPLVVSCAAIGVWGLARPLDARSGTTVRRLFPWLLGPLVLMLLQVVPLDPHTIARLSPGTHALLQVTDLGYGLPGARHGLSLNPRGTVLSALLFVGFSVFLLGLVRRLNGSTIRVTVIGLSAVGLLMSVAGIVQAATWNGKIYGLWSPTTSVGVAAFGPFVNRNHFAGWVLLVLPLALAYVIAEVQQRTTGGLRDRLVWLSTASGNTTLFVGFCVLVMATAVPLSASRSGTIGLVFIIGVLIAVLLKERRQRAPWLVGAYLALTLVAALVWAGLNFIVGRFAEAGASLDGRIYVWRDAWRVHGLFPWFGTGINGYGSAMTVHQQFMPDAFHYAQAHNDYLQLLAEGGWLFAGAVLAVVAVGAIEVRRRFQERRDSASGHWFRVGAVTGIAAIAIQEIAEFSLQMPAVFAVFCLASAIALRPSTFHATASGPSGSNR